MEFVKTVAKKLYINKIPGVNYLYRYVQDWSFVKYNNTADIDICTICHSNCIYCLHQREKLVKPEIMDFGLFKKIVTILASENYNFIHLYQSGEPMLHPKIYDMIELVSSLGIKVFIGTRLNAKIDFTKLENVVSRLKSNVVFFITIDNICEENIVSPGINQELVQLNIRSLSHLLKYDNITFTFSSIVTADNEKDFESVRVYLNNLGFYDWSANSMGYYLWRYAPQKELDLMAKYIPKLNKYKDRFDIVNGKVKDKFKYCTNQMPSIDVHGNVSICCHDMTHTTNLGNVVELNSLRDIIGTKKYKEMVKLVRSRKLELCKSCN